MSGARLLCGGRMAADQSCAPQAEARVAGGQVSLAVPAYSVVTLHGKAAQ